LGGTHPIQRGFTKDRQQRIVKPHHEPFRAHGDYAAAKIGRHLNPDYPDVEVRRHGHDLASEQEFIEGKSFVPKNPEDLSPEDLKSIVQDSVFN